ncbi:Ketopantoate hydroxymethyltransferase, partial [mine drainage metagenome]
ISQRLHIPTIGIGCGSACDGQVLVLHDMIGLGGGPAPRHAHHYAEVGQAIADAAAAYGSDVREGRFPAPENATALGPAADDVLAAMRLVERRQARGAAEDGAEIRPYGGGR